MSTPSEDIDAWSPDFTSDDTLQPDPGGSDVPPLEVPLEAPPTGEDEGETTDES